MYPFAILKLLNTLISVKPWLTNIMLYNTIRNERYKARLVTQGFKQLPGVDYDQTILPVIKPTTIRLILSHVISNNWLIRQLDIKNTFLNGTLTETVFIRQPPGFIHLDHPTHICHLHKSFYGLKQAPRAWFQTFSSFLLSKGFIQSKADTILYTFHFGDSLVFLLVYIDDIIISAPPLPCSLKLCLDLNPPFLK
ncbi:transmembrane signal receptor [Lithospermum erythrorhizon]|uniref:Transmembrane signal receptor n=1 Tax=Lithospermum erythrorhizon TaxID=34254 RepID=A0AAV3QXU6_LITER